MTTGAIAWMLGCAIGAALGFAGGWDIANARWRRAIAASLKDEDEPISSAMLREIADEIDTADRKGGKDG